MIGPLVILAVFALGFGFFAQSGFYSYLDTNFEHYGVNFHELGVIGGHISEAGAAEGEGAGEPLVIKILPYIIAIGGIFVAMLFYYWRKLDPGLVTSERDPIRKLLLKGYYQHEIFTAWFAETVVYGIAILCNMIDIKIVDGVLNRISEVIVGFGGNLRKVQTGVVQNYITAIVLGIVVLVIVIEIGMKVGL